MKERLYWWDELSDSELVARLTNRGMAVEDAASWVNYRNTEGGAETIDNMIEA